MKPDAVSDDRRRLVPHSAGIQPEVVRDSITLTLTGGAGFEHIVLRVGFDGRVVGEARSAATSAASAAWW